ncbi:hypothetical protein KP509_11G038000 [Ceratopteris richardii]|nr:hypothetical protein KP509_11G038000 [Ceratopteris richardii]
MITCLYRVKIGTMSPFVTITWCRSLVGLGLSLNVQENPTYGSAQGTRNMVDTKPWLFAKKKGSKVLEVARNFSVNVVWDLTNATYTSGPEPNQGFFFALAYDDEIVLLLGDMTEDAYEKAHAKSISSDTVMISRREHIFGQKQYSTKAQFIENGPMHDVLIECNTRGKDPKLCVRVDKHLLLQVKRLAWKFRGNETISVDGYPVQFFWDLHNWLFSPNDGHAVFMFHTNMSTDKSFSSFTSSSPSSEWHCGTRSPLSMKDVDISGFSLLLYAWKNDI